jgi:hypothetical protein
MMPSSRLPPEIWGEVFAHLQEEPSTLAAAARICTAWLAPAAAALWRRPTPRAFSSCDAMGERARGIYAPADRLLSIDDSTTPDVLGRWHFPGARALHYDLQREQSPLNAPLVRLALERCGPLLEYVRLGQYGFGWITCENAMAGRDMDSHPASCVDYDTMAILGLHRGLKYLVSDNHATFDVMSRLSLEDRQLFASLEQLSVPIRMWDVIALVQLLHRSPLVALCLSLTSRAPLPFIGLLVGLEHLRVLTLAWQCWDSLPPGDFVRLSILPSGLQQLSLLYLDRRSDPCACRTQTLSPLYHVCRT